jgi:hypothetical protein
MKTDKIGSDPRIELIRRSVKRADKRLQEHLKRVDRLTKKYDLLIKKLENLNSEK